MDKTQIEKHKQHAETKIREAILDICDEFYWGTGLQINEVNVEFIEVQAVAESAPKHYLGSVKINVGI